MRFLKNFWIGLKSYAYAVRFLVRHKLYWFLAIPAVFMLLIYRLGASIQSNHVEPVAEDMNALIWYLIYLLIEISVAILLMKFAKYLVVASLSPLLSYLSVRTEKIITGKTYPFSFKQLIHDIRRAIRIVIRNLMWEYFFFLIIFIVSFLGWENPRSAPIFYLTFLIGFFYYGFSFLDYINERRRLDMDQSITFVRDHRGLAISIGAVYSLMILVPVDLGALFDWSGFNEAPWYTLKRFFIHLLLWISASAAPILAIIASTLAMHEIVDLKSNRYAQNVDKLPR